MLDKYKDSQNVVYSLLKNAINNDKLSHAYLFDVNNNPYAMDIILSFVKEIFCLNKNSEEQDIICKRIDDGNFLELKIINPDGLVIKKEQLSDLQEEYSMSSIESDRRIYIINNCERMNLQAANSILKFLEEPLPNIIAILVTNNINNVLKTIISRCQVLFLKKENIVFTDNSFRNFASIITNGSSVDDFVNNEKNKLLFDNTISFIEYLENNKSYTIVYIKTKMYDIFKDRIDNLFAVDIMINFYYDLLRFKVSGQAYIFNEYDYLINKFSYMNVDKIILRLETLLDVKKMLLSNVNINLVLDYLIIQFERSCS